MSIPTGPRALQIENDTVFLIMKEKSLEANKLFYPRLVLFEVLAGFKDEPE